MEYNEKPYLAFLDIEKAFDRVPRHKLWQAMNKAEYDIPPELLTVIQGMYSECKSAVRTANYAVGEWFNVKTGVRQGSVLSPLL